MLILKKNLPFGLKVSLSMNGSAVRKRLTEQDVTLEMIAGRASEEVGVKTGINYRTALNSFRDFCGGRTVPVRNITQPMVFRYQRWLYAGGISPNTAACYIRQLRSLYNKAVKHYRLRNRYPFTGIFTGNVKACKRSIALADINRIALADLSRSPELAVARDMFLFSFFAMGMPFIDMVGLRKSQVAGGFITYRRHKTGQEVRVSVEPCMREIMDRYAGCDGRYVFPFARCGTRTGAYRKYQSHLATYNRRLKRLGAVCGIPKGLSSYIPRHTWASAAYRNGVAVPVISRALGHTNTKTTMVYIRELDDRWIYDANRQIIKKTIESDNAQKCEKETCGGVNYYV